MQKFYKGFFDTNNYFVFKGIFLSFILPISSFSYLRQRKDRHAVGEYPIDKMKKLLLGPTTTVAETLSQMPQASQIFIRYHTGCIGCFLVRFCTLKEMADIYKVDLTSFVDALQKLSSPASKLEKGD